ncbi:hypothetical protein AB4Y45_16265 [Paraburkholderia sp. EG287A]|uniref:hypothetical protein n=1 Tax=unclassified Paraburkholderia TaxID=2615204 RepID=UPI0034D18452
MTQGSYDVVIAGGGLGGAALGRALASAGVHTALIYPVGTQRFRTYFVSWGGQRAQRAARQRFFVEGEILPGG